MTAAGWTVMCLSIGTVLCLVSFCLTMVLFGGSSPDEPD